MNGEYQVVLITVPNPEEGKKIAQGLIENRLAACVNMIHGIESVYRWQDKVHCDQESLLVCKTESRQWPALLQWVKSNHPYDVPEIIQLPVLAGSASYLHWIAESVG